MNIDGINTGYVLDHIQAGKAIQIYDMLNLDRLECTVALIQRVKSTKYGLKDIIKIDADIDLNYDVLGFADPNITVNRVRDKKLLEKVHLELPEVLTGVIECHNPRCVTSVEQEIEHQFRLVDRENRKYRCVYCDVIYREKK